MISSRILIAAASLITLGAAAGVSLDRAVQMHHNSAAVDFHQVHHDPIGVIERVIDLRPEQRERIAAILQRRQHDVDAAWHDAHARINATIDSVMTEITAELDPDQAARFRRLAEELHNTGRISHPQH
jgi:Spy/CpxP family protein refolding chaperone